MKVEDLAVLKEECQPPLQWKLVCVVDVHPGPDGHVRVITIRTSAGKEFGRPVIKLALVPTSEEEPDT